MFIGITPGAHRPNAWMSSGAAKLWFVSLFAVLKGVGLVLLFFGAIFFNYASYKRIRKPNRIRCTNRNRNFFHRGIRYRNRKFIRHRYYYHNSNHITYVMFGFLFSIA